MAEAASSPATAAGATLSARLGAFVAGLDHAALPPEVAEKARTCLVYSYGIGLGCGNTPYAPVARETALALHGETADGATLFVDGRKTTITGAALANAALMHGRTQEDTTGACHVGVVSIPAMTALAEAKALPMDRFLPAVVAAYEAAALLELAYGRFSVPRGFRSSPVYGVIGAAAGAARLLGLDGDRTGAAVAMAASFAGGVLQSFSDGTDEWRYQVGHFGGAGVTAAMLARAGAVTAPHAFEGAAGLVSVFADQPCDVDALAARLGRDWGIMETGFKPYPVCAFNQTPVTAALTLRERLGGQTPKSVRVRMNPFECGYAGMDVHGPFNSISGTLMSIPFCIASTLVRGTPTMAMMTTYNDAPVNALERRISLVADSAVPTLCCVIEAALEDGTTVVQDQRMSVRDYAYDRAGVAALIRRVGAETGVPESAFARIEAFADGLPKADVADVIAAFAEVPQP